MPRYFTVAEARQHLPDVGIAILGGIEAKKNLEAAEEDHRARIERIMFAGGMVVNREAASNTREKRETNAAKLKQVFDSLQEIGCLVKDLDIGLIDFPALYRGKEVYLCWKLGEPDIAWWHPIEEGFASRRPIDTDFLRECGGS